MDVFDGPIRGGTRGGAAEFKWTDVVADKDRENYLGHSINAPTGRWQKNKDIHWYSRDDKQTDLQRAEEIRRIKEAEADILAIQLGFKPAPKPGEMSNVPVTAIPLPTAPSADFVAAPADDPESKQLARQEKARRKEEKRARKEEKRERKEMERMEKEKDSRHSHSHRRRNSRSRSPDRVRRRSPERSYRRRSPAAPHRPSRDDRTPPYGRGDRGREGYGANDRDRQRDKRPGDERQRPERSGEPRRGW